MELTLHPANNACSSERTLSPSVSAVQFSPDAHHVVVGIEAEGFFVLCVQCSQSFLVCRPCDRGQRTCSIDCRRARRRATARAAQDRHRKTRAGRRDHAAHQRAYRARRTELMSKVIDQGRCKFDVAQDAAPGVPAPPNRSAEPQVRAFAARCAFCERGIQSIVRRGRGARPTRSHRRPRLPGGPAPPRRQHDHFTRR